MHRELGMSMEQSYEQANALEQSITSGAEQTYMGQIAAEGRLMDTMQQGEEASGALAARAGASGIKSGGTMAEVLQSQIGQQTNQMRKQIDSAREINMEGLKTQGRALNNMRNQFDKGSSFMDLYNYKRKQVTDGAQLDIDYANKIYDQNTYNVGWFLADAFDVIGAGANLYTSGVQQGWWGSSSSKPNTSNVGTGRMSNRRSNNG